MRPDIRQSLLHIVTGLPADLSQQKNWEKILKWLYDEQIQNLFFRQADHRMVPEQAFKHLEKFYYGTLTANTYRMKAVEELESVLANEKKFILIVKGAALINNAFPDPGTRPMEDIDVIIKPEDLISFKKILIQTGYKNKSNFPLMFEKAGISIDLHTHFLHTDRIESRKHINLMDLTQVWENSIPWATDFEYIRRPDDADHLIILSHHMIKHSFSKLMWLTDVYQIIKNAEPSLWHTISERLTTIYQKRAIYYVLYLLESMFNYRLPKGSGFHGYPRYLSRMEKGILNLRIIGKSMGDFGNILWLFCIPGIKERLNYLLETLFPQEDVLRREQCMNQNQPLLIYADRILMLLRSLLKNLKIVSGTFRKRFSS